MYDKTITLFNRYDSQTGTVWYPHILTGVDLSADRGAILKKYGPDSTDNAQLHVRYHFRDGVKEITDNAGNELEWLQPKKWAKQTNDALENSITFSLDSFFWEGVWDGGIVNDAEYTDRRYEGFYAYMNAKHDNVFLITSVGGPYTVIPHFEILGK
jgi:hypothetical protein